MPKHNKNETLHKEYPEARQMTPNNVGYDYLMKNTSDIQKVFDHRATMNGASTEAKWNEKLEQSFAA